LCGRSIIIEKLDELLESKAISINQQEEDSTFFSKLKKLLPAANENQLKELENEFKNRTFVGNLVRLFISLIASSFDKIIKVRSLLVKLLKARLYSSMKENFRTHYNR